MTRTGLREALHEVALTGVGPEATTRAADLGAGARSLAATRHRRLAVGGSVLVAASVVVVAMVLVFAVLPPGRVVPATGPGSLPDRIYPSRESVLSLEQAPIGRVGVVYSAPIVDGASSWMAVGADSDKYRYVIDFGSVTGGSSATIEPSPDGSSVALGVSGAAGDFGIRLVDASSGSVTMLRVPDAALGGETDALRWSPDGRRIVLDAVVTTSQTTSTKVGRRWIFVADVADGSVHRLAESAAAAGDILGWLPDGRILLGDFRGRTNGAPGAHMVLNAVGQLGVQRVGDVGLSAELVRFTPWSLSPDGQRLAGLADPNGDNQSGVTERRDLVVWSLADGRELRRDALGRVGVAAEVVGWQTPTTPVVSFATGPHLSSDTTVSADYVGHLMAYPDGGSAPVQLVEATIGSSSRGDSSNYQTMHVASQVLATGSIRVATPPHQPWYDPRTLAPSLLHRPAVLVGIVAVLLGAVALVRGLLSRRRRRTAASRSGS